MSYPTPTVAGDQLPANDLNDFIFNPKYTYGESIGALKVLYLKLSDGKVYLADYTDTTTLDTLIGVSITVGVLNDTNYVLPPGKVVTGVSGLTQGARVYLNTAGGVTATITGFAIGVALSTTSFVFMPETQKTPAGAVLANASSVTPFGWLNCDGSAVSRTTYAALFAALVKSLGTVTITIATPGVVSLTSHGLQTGDSIYLTTSGALPTGLTANTRYWVVKNDANSFWLATTQANALAGTKIATSGSQSGTHTSFLCPYGVGDGSTTFNLPSISGKVVVGKNTSDTEFAGLGETGGEKTHVLTTGEMAAHTHTETAFDAVVGSGANHVRWFDGVSGAGGTKTTTEVTSSVGSDTAHNNLQPYIALNYMIKT